jgi:hypothetical protein
MGYVVPGANPANFLTVEEVVDVARYLLHTGDNVKLGLQILLRTMHNPMGLGAHGTVMTGIAELHAQALDTTGRILAAYRQIAGMPLPRRRLGRAQRTERPVPARP